MCVFEEDEKGEDDAGYHEGALEGEHGGSGMCVGTAVVAVVGGMKAPGDVVQSRSRRPMLMVVRGYKGLVNR